jgi:hypothetical protein
MTMVMRRIVIVERGGLRDIVGDAEEEESAQSAREGLWLESKPSKSGHADFKPYLP